MEQEAIEQKQGPVTGKQWQHGVAYGQLQPSPIKVMVFREGTKFTYAAIVAGKSAIGGVADTIDGAVIKALLNSGAIEVIDVMAEYDAAQALRHEASVQDNPNASF